MNENFVKNKHSKQRKGLNKKNRYQKPKTRIDKSRFSQNTRLNTFQNRNMVLTDDDFPINKNYSSSENRPENYFKTSYLTSYFTRNIPKTCKNQTYKKIMEIMKNQQDNCELNKLFNNNYFFRRVHCKLISIGHQENKDMNYKLGPHTKTNNNNSWQFGSGHIQCPTFRSSSQVYSDLEMEVMSTTINCPNVTRMCKNKDNLSLEEEIFSEEEELIKEDLKGYIDLSVQDIERNDSSYRPLDFSNGRVYLD